MHPYRPIVLGGAGFAALSMLLPFASLPIFGSVNGLSADAWPALLPLIPLVIFSLTGRWDRGMEPGVGVVAVLLSAVSLLFALIKVGDAIVATRNTAAASMGPGSWILASAALLTTAGAAYGLFSRT